MTLRIGISARLLHAPPPGLGLPLKRLQYLESNMAHWIMNYGVVALMIPFIDQRTPTLRKRPPTADLVENLDGAMQSFLTASQNISDGSQALAAGAGERAGAPDHAPILGCHRRTPGQAAPTRHRHR